MLLSLKETITIFLLAVVTFKAAAQNDTQVLKAPTDSSVNLTQPDSSLEEPGNLSVRDSLSVIRSNIEDILADTIDFSSATFNIDSFDRDTNSIFIPNTLSKKNSTWQTDTAFKKFLLFTGFGNEANPSIENKQILSGIVRPSQSKDNLFYTLAFIFLFLGFIKGIFSKYFNQIFTLSFQAVISQRQSREQLGQNNLPSLLMNILFIFSGSLFFTLIAQYFKWINTNYWLLLLYAAVLLSAVYLIKFCFINFTGWIFNVRQPANSYSFIVFLINKILGVLLLPMLLIIAFADEPVKKISITATLCMVMFFFMFRYFFSLANIRKNLNITAFHFFIYLCAVEIMPLLIIYKALVLFIEIKKSN